MKIIKSGTNKITLDEVTFTCPRCGCVYIASGDEYVLNTKAKTCYANCPHCHYMNAYKDKAIVNSDPGAVLLRSKD